MVSTLTRRKPGRPRKGSEKNYLDTRQELIKAGLAALTEKGYSYTGLEEILQAAQVPKGSFYHYFGSKEAFGEALINAYNAYFVNKLERCFHDEGKSPIERLLAFVNDAQSGMQKFAYRRGCLVGNLGQEMAALPSGFRTLLQNALLDWEAKTVQLLQEAIAAKEVLPHLDCEAMAHFFWVGWEGAVLRAKLDQSAEPLTLFANTFVSLIKRT